MSQPTTPVATGPGSGADYFARQADRYARHRPTYPKELFSQLAELCERHELAWDAGTGSGQAAVGLAGHFERVLATDASDEQIAHARVHPGVTYRRAAAHESGLESGSVDLVTVATALHWFDLEAFYSEVHRVLRPGGLIAIWGYQDTHIDPGLDPVLVRYRSEVVGADWAFQVRLLTERYQTIAFPFDEVPAPEGLVAQASMALDDLIGYLESWSATQRYRERMGRDPIGVIRPELQAAWGAAHTVRSVQWPLFVRVGRTRPSA